MFSHFGGLPPPSLQGWKWTREGCHVSAISCQLKLFMPSYTRKTFAASLHEQNPKPFIFLPLSQISLLLENICMCKRSTRERYPLTYKKVVRTRLFYWILNLAILKSCRELLLNPIWFFRYSYLHQTHSLSDIQTQRKVFQQTTTLNRQFTSLRGLKAKQFWWAMIVVDVT